MFIDIAKVNPNPEQPRKSFDQTELEELSVSIKAHGVIQPIVVEEACGSYILHDGERRLRAAKMAGLVTIEAVITPPLNGTGPRQRLERALVANVQRSDMHQIEEARGYQRLIEEFGYKIGEVAARVGKHYTFIFSRLQLLKLEPEVQGLMLDGRINSVQDDVVKALLSLPNAKVQVELARKLAEAGGKAGGRMIVRACERYNQLNAGRKDRKDRKGSPAVRTVQMKPTGWDALQQLGHVPPWKKFAEQVTATCASCPMQDIAGDATCGECGLVGFVRRMVTDVH